MEKQLTARELADRLNLSLRTLEFLIVRNEVPQHYRLGRARRWDPKVVSEWIAGRVAGSISSITVAEVVGQHISSQRITSKGASQGLDLPEKTLKGES